MTFNDTSTSQGICQEVDSICGSNTISYPLVDKTRRANSALSDFVTIALDSDTNWQFDDSNFSDLPIGTTNLVTSQTDYTLDVSMLKILKVECKDSNGNWIELVPVDQNDVNQPLMETFETTGTPEYYDKIDSSVMLYPAPSYNSTAGLKIYYQRDASPFVSTDTTKVPGIPSLFHKYIALKIAEPYARDKKLENYVSIRNEITKYEEETIPNFFAKRAKDERPVMSGRVIDCQ
jgi:hypothetical protein